MQRKNLLLNRFIIIIEETEKRPASHALFGKCILPAVQEYKENEDNHRARFATRIARLNRKGYQTTRKSIYVNGNLIDVFVIGRDKWINNGRWILNSLPNREFFENAITNSSYLKQMHKLKANAIFFNYPGVGCSQGKPNQGEMVAAYRAVLKLLENDIQAKQILMWGKSIGGGVQGTALDHYEFKEGVVYLSIQDQTFSALPHVTDDLIKEASSTGAINPLWDTLVPNAFSRWISGRIEDGGWTLESMSSAIQLEQQGIRQIILQNTRELMEHIGSKEDIVGDGIISARRSLAGVLLNIDFMVKHGVFGWTTKRFLGVTSEHATGYTREEEQMISDAIRRELRLSRPYELPGSTLEGIALPSRCEELSSSSRLYF